MLCSALVAHQLTNWSLQFIKTEKEELKANILPLTRGHILWKSTGV